jgi:histidinol dehydrogenase
MGVIPARVAGVSEVFLCSPPDSTAKPARSVLAAAAIAGVDRVFAVGGAGAIAALAYGTETIPRVDRIVGPGNSYVAEAKLQVSESPE